MPSQRGRTAIVTGGTDGIGYEDARALARAGGSVILASRDAARGAGAVDRIRREVPDAEVRFEQLDLASLASIAAFADRIESQLPRLDVLINNAGVMTPPQRLTTADGFELQFGLNFLGHFALTARLLPLLKQGRQPRVVSLSSVANRNGVIAFDDLQSQARYQPMPAYAQSKLADLMFAFELQRRSAAGGWGIASFAAHPGIARTNLIPNGAGRNSPSGLARRFLGPVLFQSASQGALPTLYAATAPAAEAGAYYGPDGFQETRGNVKVARTPPQANNGQVARRLWDVGEQLTGVTCS